MNTAWIIVTGASVWIALGMGGLLLMWVEMSARGRILSGLEGLDQTQLAKLGLSKVPQVYSRRTSVNRFWLRMVLHGPPRGLGLPESVIAEAKRYSRLRRKLALLAVIGIVGACIFAPSFGVPFGVVMAFSLVLHMPLPWPKEIA